MAKPKTVTARVTYLEMEVRPSLHVPMPMKPPLALMRAEAMPVAFYRYLYEQVGRKHHWFLRRQMDDEALATIVRAETTLIDVLYAGGCPAGYFELDVSALPGKVDLAYFGLCSDYVGHGFGKWFLASAIAAAWDHEPERVTVNTNTLDHPAALLLYQKFGFSPVATATQEIPILK